MDVENSTKRPFQPCLVKKEALYFSLLFRLKTLIKIITDAPTPDFSVVTRNKFVCIFYQT